MRAIRLSRDIRPVSDLKTHGGELIRQVVETRQPVVFSRHGRAVAVLLQVDDFEDLVASSDRAELLDALESAERELDAGEGIPHAVMKEKLQRWAGGGD